MAKKLFVRKRGGVPKFVVWDDGMVSAVSFAKVSGEDAGDLTDSLVQGVAEALAAAGTNQATAAAITYSSVAVTASDGTKGVKLPSADNGSVVTVINTVADQILKVYPATGDIINAESANASVSIGPGKTAVFIATSASQWYVASVALNTATTTELNTVAGVTAGTGLASKALVLSADTTITISAVPTSATPGTLRTVIGEMVPTPATTITSGTLVGVRGHLSFPTGKTITGGAFLVGAQGKLSIAGTMNHADSRLAGLFAQLDTTGATLTSGQISALWVDHGAGITGDGGGQFNMVRISNTVAGSKPNGIIYAHSNATYLLDLSAPGGTMDWFANAGTGSGSAGESGKCEAPKVLFINVGGVAYYIPAFATNA